MYNKLYTLKSNKNLIIEFIGDDILFRVYRDGEIKSIFVLPIIVFINIESIIADCRFINEKDYLNRKVIKDVWSSRLQTNKWFLPSEEELVQYKYNIILVENALYTLTVYEEFLNLVIDMFTGKYIGTFNFTYDNYLEILSVLNL